MAYRRPRGDYSSADAYRAVRNPSSPPSSQGHGSSSYAPASSSEEETHLTSPPPVSPGMPYSPRGRAVAANRDDSPSPGPREESPLSPPRPFFLASRERGSWSTSDSLSLDPASDSDRDVATPKEGSTPEASTVNAAGAGQSHRAARTRSNTGGPTTNAGSARSRNHHRRRSSDSQGPFATPVAETGTLRGAPPPSSFPFLSHAGNPDPGTHIPGSMAKRASVESVRRLSRPPSRSSITTQQAQVGYAPVRNGSELDVVDTDAQDGLARPYAPFMGAGGEGSPRGSFQGERGSWSNGSSVYKNSAAAAMMSGSNSALPQGPDGYASIPRTNSQTQIAMRAPFLSPASRPSSSVWSPPSYVSYASLPPIPHSNSSYPPSASLPYLPPGSPNPYLTPRKNKTLMPSSRLESKLSPEEKPWMKQISKRERISWWLTLAMMFIGVACAAIVIYFGWTGVHQLKDDQLCMVLNDNFNSLDLDNTWVRDVELGGFGNGEFEMTTSDSKNMFIRNNQLYIKPTLTSDEIGKDAVLDGGKYTLADCNAGTDASTYVGPQSGGKQNCTASSNKAAHAVIPPVQSARISTKNRYSIKYGKVEVRAKLPRGDWLWPAIWMLPVDNKYGPWPMSGEIDIMEARGNGPEYPAQGSNYVRSSLNYGVLNTVQTHIVGWWQQKRFSYADDFHTYALEWTPDWMRFYVDTRLQATINLKLTGKGGKSFFDRGKYPATAHNGTDAEVVVDNIWEEAGGAPSAPFDQEFFLIINLAAGGTSGWFPDNQGGKPWYDASQGAMEAFALDQDNWYSTWAKSDEDLAFRIDSVKMWKLGRC